MDEVRLYKKFKEEVVPALMKELDIKNVMGVPSIEKIVINSGVGDFKDSKEALAVFEEELSNIAGQKVSERKARKSEAGFKIRKGEVVGYSVTLRGSRMWAFLDKFINIVLPRVRDFNGLSTTAFDKAGNYSVGIKEHTIFPEVNPNTTKGIRSLQVVIVTNSGDMEKSRKLLELVGLPFKKDEKRK